MAIWSCRGKKKTMLKNKAATISVEVNWKWNSVLATNMRPWLLLFRLNLWWNRHSWNRFTNLRHQALKMSMDSMMPGIQGRLSKQRPLVENCYKNPLETCLPTIFPSNKFFCNETPLSQLMTGGLNEVAPWGPWKSRRWRMQIHLKNQHLDVLSQDLTICESWFVLHVEFFTPSFWSQNSLQTFRIWQDLPNVMMQTSASTSSTSRSGWILGKIGVTCKLGHGSFLRSELMALPAQNGSTSISETPHTFQPCGTKLLYHWRPWKAIQTGHAI